MFACVREREREREREKKRGGLRIRGSLIPKQAEFPGQVSNNSKSSYTNQVNFLSSRGPS